MAVSRTWPLVSLLCLVVYTNAHDHSSESDEESLGKPIDSILWIHIFIQLCTWGLLFPIGMVLGITRSRWHVPVQATGFLLTLGGYILGHPHRGRKFPTNMHEKFGGILVIPILVQLVLGIYLKLHIHEKSIRPYAVILHGILGKSWPILGWCQMLFGAMAIGGYCYGDNITQCLAHYIMGSAFIGYGILLAVALFVGQNWLSRKGMSQEWFDSWVIMLWGIVNTFTEHHGSLTVWSHKDLQHTMLGVLWWAGGALGIFVSRKGKRSIVPAVIIIMTGWAMSAHEQAMMISTKVHGMFGIVLMSAGLARLIEISFVLKDARHSPPSVDIDDEDTQSPVIRSFQHLPPFLLVTGGLLFMSATDEELRYIASIQVDHATYIMIMFSLGFVIYLHTVFLLNLYFTTGRNASGSGSRLPGAKPEGVNVRPGSANGYREIPPSPWYPGVGQDAEVFELGAIEDDDDDDETRPERLTVPPRL